MNISCENPFKFGKTEYMTYCDAMHYIATLKEPLHEIVDLISGKLSQFTMSEFKEAIRTLSLEQMLILLSVPDFNGHLGLYYNCEVVPFRHTDELSEAAAVAVNGIAASGRDLFNLGQLTHRTFLCSCLMKEAKRYNAKVIIANRILSLLVLEAEKRSKSIKLETNRLSRIIYSTAIISERKNSAVLLSDINLNMALSTN